MFSSWSIVLTFLAYILCTDAWNRHQMALFRPLRIVVPIVAAISLNSATLEIANAVSGGGKDYATKDIRGQNFDGQNLMTKDFTQCDGTGTTFKGANLKGSRFYRANLKDADFTNADLSTASLEDTSLIDADFTNAILEGAYFSGSITEAKSLKGADFTDALMPEFAKSKLCTRPDVSSSNPKTGVSTAESLFCP